MIAIPVTMTEPASALGASSSGKPEPTTSAQTSTRAEETAIIARAQKGDLGAYDELIRRYQERIYATVYHMTSNHEDANDLTQEAFIKAYHALKSFKETLEKAADAIDVELNIEE